MRTSAIRTLHTMYLIACDENLHVQGVQRGTDPRGTSLVSD